MIDIQKPPEVERSDINSPVIPKEESITTVNLTSSQYTPVIEEVPKENIFQLSTESFDEEENPEWVYEKGDINQIDYTVEAGSPLGATDRYGNYYPNALPEGGTILLGGVPMIIKYGGYYDQNAFLSFTDKDDLSVGKTLSDASLLSANQYGKAFDSVNTPELHQGTEEKKVYTDTRGDDSEKSSYGVVLTVVGFPNSILPDRLHNGKKVYETPNGFRINRSGVTETEKGFLAETLFKIKVDEEGKFVFEVLGILKGNQISFEPTSLPEDIMELAVEE